MRGALAALWLVLGLLSSPEVVLAQDEPVEAPVPPDEPPGDDRIQPLSARQAAPFDGQLLDTDTAIRWTHRLEWYYDELHLAYRLRATLLAAERRSHEIELRLTTESMQREIEGLRQDLRDQAATAAQALAQAREHPWYDTFVFGFVVGVLAVGLVMGVTAGLLSQI